MNVTTRYTYEGVVNKSGRSLDRISLKVTGVDYDLDPAGPTPLNLKSSDLKVSESGGELLYNRAGYVAYQKANVRIQGELGFEINGVELGGTLDLKMSVQASTVDQTAR